MDHKSILTHWKSAQKKSLTPRGILTAVANTFNIWSQLTYDVNKSSIF